jgi:hypothetical protein
MSRKIGMNSLPDGTRVAAFAMAVALTSACSRQNTVQTTSPPVTAQPTVNTRPAAGGPTRVEKDLLDENNKFLPRRTTASRLNEHWRTFKYRESKSTAIPNSYKLGQS